MNFLKLQKSMISSEISKCVEHHIFYSDCSIREYLKELFELTVLLECIYIDDRYIADCFIRVYLYELLNNVMRFF